MLGKRLAYFWLLYYCHKTIFHCWTSTRESPIWWTCCGFASATHLGGIVRQTRRISDAFEIGVLDFIGHPRPARSELRLNWRVIASDCRRCGRAVPASVRNASGALFSPMLRDFLKCAAWGYSISAISAKLPSAPKTCNSLSMVEADDEYSEVAGSAGASATNRTHLATSTSVPGYAVRQPSDATRRLLAQCNIFFSWCGGDSTREFLERHQTCLWVTYCMLKIVLISGLSGSGNSVALRQMEDSGYFCVTTCLGNVIRAGVVSYRACGRNRIGGQRRCAFRHGASDRRREQDCLSLRGLGHRVEVLVCRGVKRAVLVLRFSKTRQRPPCVVIRIWPCWESLKKEREWLFLLKEIALVVIDTSRMNQQLRHAVRQWLEESGRYRSCWWFWSRWGSKCGVCQTTCVFMFDMRQVC